MTRFSSTITRKNMSKGKCVYRVLLVLGIITSSACSSQKIPKIQYSEPSGRDIYVARCAECHGEDAKGKPAAVAGLPDGRADLTVLSKRNGGKFPEERLKLILGGLEDIPAHHGPKPMPIWGDIFDTTNAEVRETASRRVDSLTTYLESIQQP